MQLELRPAGDADRRQLAICSRQSPRARRDRDRAPGRRGSWAGKWRLEGTFLAVAEGELVGSLSIEESRFDFGELGMAVARDWRGRGVF